MSLIHDTLFDRELRARILRKRFSAAFPNEPVGDEPSRDGPVSAGFQEAVLQATTETFNIDDALLYLRMLGWRPRGEFLTCLENLLWYLDEDLANIIAAKAVSTGDPGPIEAPVVALVGPLHDTKRPSVLLAHPDLRRYARLVSLNCDAAGMLFHDGPPDIVPWHWLGEIIEVRSVPVVSRRAVLTAVEAFLANGAPACFPPRLMRQPEAVETNLMVREAVPSLARIASLTGEIARCLTNGDVSHTLLAVEAAKQELDRLGRLSMIPQINLSAAS